MSNGRGRKSVRIAVTSVGSGIGQSIVDSCRRSSLPIHLTGMDMNPLAYGLYDCDVRLAATPIDDPGYVDRVLDVCCEHDIHLLIPALDDELHMFSLAASRFREHGIEVLVAPPDLVGLCRDKLAWAREFSAITDTVLPAMNPAQAQEALESGHVHLPLIAKPIDGSASAGVAIVRKAADLRSLHERMMVQPYLLPMKGDVNLDVLQQAVDRGKNPQLSEFSLQYVFSKQGDLVGQMGTLNRLANGVPTEIVPIDYEPLDDELKPLVHLLKQFGARGPINLQGRLTDSGPRFWEINTRFTGITGNRSMFGFNEVDWLVRDWLGLPRPEWSLAVNPRRVGLRQVGMRVVDIEAVAQTAVAPSRFGKQTQRTVAVAGASGWLGRHVLAALSASDGVGEVRGLVRSEESRKSLHGWLAANDVDATVSIVPGTEFAFGLGTVDLLVNLASARPPSGDAAVAASLMYQINLLGEAESLGVPAIVNVSSRTVYGNNPGKPSEEDDIVAPSDQYSMMKWAVERYVQRIADSNTLINATSLRMSQVYGYADCMRWAELPHAFARSAALGEPITIFGGNFYSNLIHIRDAVSALIAVVEGDPAKWANIYNVAADNEITLTAIADAANIAARAAGLPGAEIIMEPGSDDRRLQVDNSRLRGVGWVPQVGLTEAMDELVGRAMMIDSTSQTTDRR